MTEVAPQALAAVYKAVARRCGVELRSIALPDIPSGWTQDGEGGGWVRPGFQPSETAPKSIIAANFPQKAP